MVNFSQGAAATDYLRLFGLTALAYCWARMAEIALARQDGAEDPAFYRAKLATARFFCDRIAIMYLGRIVELGPAEAIYANPRHPYTESLLRAIPEPDPSRSVPRDLPRGEIPDAVSPPPAAGPTAARPPEAARRAASSASRSCRWHSTRTPSTLRSRGSSGS